MLLFWYVMGHFFYHYVEYLCVCTNSSESEISSQILRLQDSVNSLLKVSTSMERILLNATVFRIDTFCYIYIECHSKVVIG